MSIVNPRIFLASDSTCQTYSSEYAPQAGWGQFISHYFTDDLSFYNHAIGGRSSKTFVEEGRLDVILEEIEEGDYLFVQMGHNDSTVAKPERYTDPFTTYKTYLKKYVDGVRKKKAILILITPVGRLHYEDGVFKNDFPDYCHAMKEVAEEEEVILIDLMAASLAYYQSIGLEEAKTLFMVSFNGTDHTHFTQKGADAIAQLVSKEVKKLGLDLSHYVKEGLNQKR